MAVASCSTPQPAQRTARSRPCCVSCGIVRALRTRHFGQVQFISRVGMELMADEILDRAAEKRVNLA
jgi:hypothetical protein